MSYNLYADGILKDPIFRHNPYVDLHGVLWLHDDLILWSREGYFSRRWSHVKSMYCGFPFDDKVIKEWVASPICEMMFKEPRIELIMYLHLVVFNYTREDLLEIKGGCRGISSLDNDIVLFIRALKRGYEAYKLINDYVTNHMLKVYLFVHCGEYKAAIDHLRTNPTEVEERVRQWGELPYSLKRFLRPIEQWTEEEKAFSQVEQSRVPFQLPSGYIHSHVRLDRLYRMR